VELRHGRWRERSGIVPTEHDQFDGPDLAFTRTLFAELNHALVSGAFARSATLPGSDTVTFKLAFDPKGHLASAWNDEAQLEGTLRRDADGHLSFAADPSCAQALRIAPLLDALLQQLERTSRAQDDLLSSVLLFGTVCTDGALTLANTVQSAAVDAERTPTPSTSYVVSDDTVASLRALVAAQAGKSVVVRAVLTEDEPARARVIASWAGSRGAGGSSTRPAGARSRAPTPS